MQNQVVIAPFAGALLLGFALWLIRPEPEPTITRPSAEAIAEVVQNLYDRRSPRMQALVGMRKSRILERALKKGEPIAGHQMISLSEAQAIDAIGQDRIDTPFVCLARTIYWEAKGEGVEGMQAVAIVVLNRLQRAGFPDTICDVIMESGGGTCQFSWWCDGRVDEVKEVDAYNIAKEVTRLALNGKLQDGTGGALYYHARSVDPFWATSYKNTARIGNHLFYRPADGRDR